MTGADSNVLLRALVQDDAKQGGDVVHFLQSARASGEPILITTIVLCETVWTLRSRLGWRRPQIADAIDLLLVADVFLIEHEDLVAAALQQYREGKGDFPDYLIGQVSRSKGCRHVVTFDEDLIGTAGFAPVSKR